MPMKHRIEKSRNGRITLRPIELFEQLKRCRCTCDPDDQDHRFECPGCKKRLELDEQIGIECQTPIWVYPCVENPLGKNPYPPGHANYASRGTHNPEGRALWRALER